MTKSIDFYFDIISPYSYIAHKKIEKVIKEKNILFNYKPILLGGLHNLAGISAPAFNKYKLKNFQSDCELVSKKNNISFKWNLKFPINSLSIMRGYVVTEKAKVVLGKVAKVINDKPEFEAMIEGHTDSRSYSNGVLIDNWDLSVKRSTSIIRELQTMGVNPSQLIAAGRSSYVPLVDNETAENRARNRRTRVVVMPKIDQFYEMIEKEMKELSLE